MPRTLNNSTLWYAATARPLSVMIVGCAHLGLIAHVLDVIDDVVRVFLQRVIDARFEVGLRPVIVDSETAARHP